MSTVSTDKPRPERLAKARHLAAMTQEQWARALEISVFMVGKCERGTRSPGMGLLRRISLLSGKPIEWFYGEESA